MVPFDAQDEDGLKFSCGKGNPISSTARQFAGTMLAHMDGGVPNLVIELDKMELIILGRWFISLKRQSASAAIFWM